MLREQCTAVRAPDSTRGVWLASIDVGSWEQSGLVSLSGAAAADHSSLQSHNKPRSDSVTWTGRET